MAHPIVDTKLDSLPDNLLFAKHIDFLSSYSRVKDPTLDYMRMNGMFWTLTALDLLGQLEKINKNDVINFVVSCQKSDGGLSPAPMHDSHLLSTLSGVQILSMYNSLDRIDLDGVAKFVANLQQPDGSFSGDRWGEIDTRYTFCALASLRLIGHLNDRSECDLINVEECASYLERCQNLDGGFGTQPGSESHAGQAYCVIGALALLHQLRRINLERAAWWLAERQLPSGGLNGRPEKQPDVCYSWWALSTLTILGRLLWIDKFALTRFILASQDCETGGIADRPGNCPDPFHTLFGLAGLSLLARKCPLSQSEDVSVDEDGGDDEDVFLTNNVDADDLEPKMNQLSLRTLAITRRKLKEINPVLCMPQYVLDRMQIKVQTES